MKEKIFDIVNNLLDKSFLECVQIFVSNKDGWYNVDVVIDKIDGSRVTFDDCEFVNKNLSNAIDVERLFHDNYSIKVLSAGIDRPLTKIADYERFVNKDVRVLLHSVSEDVKGKSIVGKIVKVLGEDIIFLLNKNKLEIKVGFSDIKAGRLDLVKDLLKK